MMRAVFVVLLLGHASCGRDPVPSQTATLFEKGPYQAIYGPDGTITRLLYDGNGDRIADVVTVFDSTGAARQTETDTDHDGAVDRWQFFSRSGEVEKEAVARRKPGTPDLWLYPIASGVRRELDEDGNGVVDRTEHFDAQRLARVEVDGDGDGRMDRWQSWSEDRLVQEDLDTDGDGVADRRLRNDPQGGGLRLEMIGRSDAVRGRTPPPAH
jgi:hypothetical protein